MKLLILTSGESEMLDTTTEHITEALIQRGHSVDVLDTDDLIVEAAEKSPWYLRICRQRSTAVLRSIAKSLKEYLQLHEYDVIVPTRIYCGRILDSLYKDPEAILPPMVFVYAEYDNLPRKAQLSCDEYFVFSETAQKTMQCWGIPDSRIHLIDITNHTASEICSHIEEIHKEWNALLNAFLNEI